MSNHVQEAKEAYERAEKALKTGLMKWNPDYEIAANEYSKAAQSFRNAKLPEKFMEAHMKAAKCFEASRSYFSAAKSYEQIALTARDKQDWDTMIQYFDRACSNYRENSVPDTAALTYNRAAAMIEQYRPEKAAEWYAAASDTVMLEDRYLQAAEYANKAVKIYLKLRQYEKAIFWSEKALEFNISGGETRTLSRQIATMIIIQMAKNDLIAAEKVYNQYQAQIYPDELYLLGSLIEGLDKFDNAAICSSLRSPFIESLDNEIAKIVRDLLIKYDVKKQASSSGGGNGDGPAMDEDDEVAAIL